jgi:hypothetical protein
MRFCAALLSIILLSGCAKPLEVTPIQVYDQDKFEADKTNICLPAAVNNTPPATFASIAFGVATAFLSTVGYVFLDWRIPVVEGVGGGAKTALAPWDPTGQVKVNIYNNCMQDAVRMDRSAILLNRN